MRLGFYSRRRILLPHPPYQKATLLLIERAICEAWRIIRDHPEGDFKIDVADENRITRELRTCLLERILDGSTVPGFSSEFFTITRGGEFESYNGDHLQKKPDLHIYIRRDCPTVLRCVDGLFIECKPVDVDHPVGEHYCEKGMIRFIEGEYAWAMSEGVMIGYATRGYTLPSKLEVAIAQRKTELKTNGAITKCPGSSASGYMQRPHITVHRRDFIYACCNKRAENITLRHLWFDRN